MKPLSKSALEKALHTLEWELDDGQLHKVYKFSSYLGAAAFVQSLAEQAEEVNHHPDLLLTWRKVSVWLTTHDAGGITELDLDFAQFTNQLFADQ